MTATRKKHCTKRNQAVLPRQASGVLYLAFELGWNEWKLAFSTGPAVRPRLRAIGGRNVDALVQEIAKAKTRKRGQIRMARARVRVGPSMGDRPLSWWAVRRVSEYSGRVNLWLAGGFGVLYALYTVAGPLWPNWTGRRVFMIFDETGGVPVWATALVVLAAVPAAFQYGLWDSNLQERCRRLEVLLVTRLSAFDYWHAAAAAAWRRGRGYFAVALLL